MSDSTTPSDTTSPRRNRFPWRVFAIPALVLLALLGLGLGALETPWGMTQVVRAALGPVNPWTRTRLVVGHARGGFLTGIGLGNVRLSRADGFVLASVESLEVGYDIPSLFGRPLRIRHIRAAGVRIFATRNPDGSLDLLAPFTGAPAAGPKKPARGFALDRLEIARATVTLRMPVAGRDSVVRVDSLDLALTRLATPERLVFAIDTLSATLVAPAPPEARVHVALSAALGADRFDLRSFSIEGRRTRGTGSGRLMLPSGRPRRFDGTDFRLSLNPLAGEELERFVPALGGRGDLLLEATARGEQESLVMSFDAHASRGGSVVFAARVPLHEGPAELHSRGRLINLDVGALLGGARGERIATGSWELDLAGPRPDSISGPFLVNLAGSRAKDLRLDVAKLSGRFDGGRATFAIDGASRGVRLAMRGSSRPFIGTPEYSIAGALSMPPDFLKRTGRPKRKAGPWYAGDVAFTARGRGITRDSATATARVELSPAPGSGAVLGAGTFEAALDRGRARWSADLGVASGTVRAHGDVNLAAPLTYTLADGELTGVDLAAFTGDTASSRLDARFEATGRGTDPRSAAITATIHSLALQYGPHRVDEASARLVVERGRATLEASARADGARIEAHGGLARLAPPRDAQLEASVRGLDLAKALGDTALTSDLGLRAEVRLADPTKPADTHGSVRVTFDPATIGHQRVREARLEGTLDGGELALSGHVASTFGNATLGAQGRPFDQDFRLRIDPLTIEGVDLGAVPGSNLPATQLTGTLVATLAGREPGDMNADARFSLDGSRLGPATLDRLLVTTQLAAGRVEARIEARSRGSRAIVSVHGEPFSDPLALTAHGDLDAADIGRWFGRDSIETRAALTFEGDFAMPRTGGFAAATGTVTLTGRGRAGRANLDSLMASFRLDRGILRADRLVARGNVERIEGSGRIALPGLARRDTTEFRLAGTLLDAEPLSAWLGGGLTTARSGSFSIVAHGPPSAMRFEGRVAAGGAHLGGSWADSLAVTFNGTVCDSALAGLDAKLEARSLVTGVLRPRDLDATASWDGHALGLDARSRTAGERSQQLVLRVEPVPGGTRGRVERFESRRPGSVLSLEHPVDFEFGKHIEIGELVMLDNGVHVISARGGITDAGAVNFAVDVDSLDVSDVFDLTGFEALKGTLDARGSLTGTRERPVLEASLTSRLIAGKGKPAALTGKLRSADRSTHLELAFQQANAGRISVDATVPLALQLAPPEGQGAVVRTEAPMTARLEAHRFDLAWFAPLVSPRVVRSPRGWIDGTVTANGDPDSPALAGSLALRDARAELPGLGTTYDKGHARLEFADRTMRLADAGVRSGGGTLTAHGEIELRGRGRRTVDLTTKISKFVPLDTPQAKVTLSGDLALSGRLDAPALRGNLTAHQTTVYAEATESRELEKVALTREDRVTLLERFGIDIGAEHEDHGTPADSVDVDVNFKAGENVWVRRHSDPVIALELKGGAHLRKPPGDSLEVRGDISIRTGRSYVSFSGRRFDINRADVALPGSLAQARAELDAIYAPEASNTGKDVIVRAAVTVSAQGADIRLSSQPYMDQSALINYLVTGQVEGGAEQGTAYGLALGSAIGAVGGAAGRSLGLDVVQVTMDAYGGQTLSAGSYVDPRLYLGFRQPVVEGQRSTSGLSTGSTPATEFEAEVEAGRKVLFNFQGSSTQYRFLIRPRLGR